MLHQKIAAIEDGPRAAVGAAFAGRAVLRAAETRRASPRPRSRSANQCPIAARPRPRRHRQGRRGLFQDDQRQGRGQRPQDQVHSLDDGYSPPKTVEQSAGWSSRTRWRSCSTRSARRPTPRSSNTCNDKKVPQLFVATRRRPSGATTSTSRGRWAGSRATDRGADLRQAHPAREAEREDRDALPERRFRQGLPRRASRTCSGDKFDKMVIAASYEITDPTIDSQAVTLKGRAPTCSSPPRRRNSPRR